MNDDGTMARLPELIEFARIHNLKIGTIADLINYRIRNDHIISKVLTKEIDIPKFGKWNCTVYQNNIDKSEHIMQDIVGVHADQTGATQNAGRKR